MLSNAINKVTQVQQSAGELVGYDDMTFSHAAPERWILMGNTSLVKVNMVTMVNNK